MLITMGNSNSVSEREEIGDRIFSYAKHFLQDKPFIDDAKLEGVTGIILESCADLDELRHLLTNDTKELERRITKSSLFLEVESEKASCSIKTILPSKTPNNKTNIKPEQVLKRQELINHFEKLNPSFDSVKIVDELLSLPENELNNIISDEGRFNNFLESCTSKEHELGNRKSQGIISLSVQSINLPKKLKLDDKESGSELSNSDVDAVIGNQLFQRVNKFHPSKADIITGVLMGLQKDIILHLIVLTPLLHKNIALVISELERNGKLSQRDIVTLQEEIGEVIYTILEKEMEADKASQVTGMLLEMNIAEVHEALADEKLFRNRLKAALNTLQK